MVGVASAQEVFAPRQDLDFDRPESWAMKYFASASLCSGLGTPRDSVPGSIELIGLADNLTTTPLIAR